MVKLVLTVRRSFLWVLVYGLWACSWSAYGVEYRLDDTQTQHLVGEAMEFWVTEKDQVLVRDVLSGSADPQWQPVAQQVPSFGYSKKEYWLRIQLKNLTSRPDWYFVIDYPLIRSLDIFLVEEDSIKQFYQLGDRFEFSARPIDHRNFIVPLMIPEQQSQTLYLRVRTEYAIQIPAYLIRHENYLTNEIGINLLHGLFFGLLVVMIFYNLFLFFATKESSYIYYVCFTAAAGLFQLSQHGFGYQFVWPTYIGWQHKVIPVACCLAFIFAALFAQAFLQTRQNIPQYHRWISRFCQSALVLLFVALFVSEYWAQFINSYLAIVGSLLLFAAAVTSWRDGVKEARFFVAAWLIFLVAIVVFAGNKLGLLPRNFWTEYGAQIGTGIELSLLSFALADRINTARKEQQTLLEKSQVYEQMAKSANERALTIERMGKKRLEKNIQSRTQQLQNALQELTFVNQQLEEMSAIDSLTGVKNLSCFNDKLVEEWIRGAREQHSLGLILLSVDQFELIGDRYGYEAADEILKNVGSLIEKGVTRPADLARISHSAPTTFADQAW